MTFVSWPGDKQVFNNVGYTIATVLRQFIEYIQDLHFTKEDIDTLEVEISLMKTILPILITSNMALYMPGCYLSQCTYIKYRGTDM